MDFLKGLLGAATGLATGNIPGAVLGGVAGLTSSGPQESPVMKQARLQQQQAANQMFNFAGSVPGSAPDELANMAQSRALLGEQQRQQQNRIMGAWTPDQGTSATGLLQNITNNQIGQQMAQRSSFLQDAAANRRRALMDAANLGQGAASLYRPQQPQFPQVASQLAQMLAYQQAQKQAQQQAGNGDVHTLQQQGGGLNGWYNQSPGAAPAPPPAGWQDPGVLGGISPAALAALQQSSWGMQSPNGAPGNMMLPSTLNMPDSMQGVGMQGSGAPGNQMGGMNGLQNQIRQSMGLGRTIDLGGGLRLRF